MHGDRIDQACAMLSSHCELKDVIQQKCSQYSFGDECVDDIESDPISPVLSDSNSNILSIDTEHQSFQSISKTDHDNSSLHTMGDIPSDSFQVILNSPSEQNPVFSSTEMLSQHSGVQLHEACDTSSQPVMRDSEALNGINGELILSSMKHVALQQNNDVKKINGFAQTHINRDKSKSFSKCKLSLPQHDVSRLPDFPLKFKSYDISLDTIQSQSITTISSGIKSKDSGMPRSVGCVSLSSGRKRYEQVPSKVAEYIRRIKKECKKGKFPKSCIISKESVHTDEFSDASVENNPEASKETLINKIRDLKFEIKAKDKFISELQDYITELLIKCAEAENRTDQMRFKVCHPSSKFRTWDQKKNRIFPKAESLKRGSKNQFISAYKRTLCMRAADESLPVDINDLFLRRTSNVETTSMAQFNEEDIRHNLTLNPVVTLYSGSVRLDKRVEPLSEISSAKTTEDSLEQELSLFSRMVRGRSNSERMSVAHSSNVSADEHSGSATSPDQKYVCRCTGNAVRPRDMCDPGTSRADACEFRLSRSKQCEKMPVVSEIKIPERINGEERLLRKKSLEQSGSRRLRSNSFEKVSRWQEFLPPSSELIEPSQYENFDCHSSGRKTSEQNFTQEFATVIPRPLNIDSCECWNPDVEQSSIPLGPRDQKPKNTFQDFRVPPLELGSLVDGDDAIDSDINGDNNTYTSSVTAIPEEEGMCKTNLDFSTEENLSSGHQDISESTTYSSSTYATSDFQASKTQNHVEFSSNNVDPHLINACVTDSQQEPKTYGRKSQRMQYNNVQHLKDDAAGKIMNQSNIQNDSLPASSATSTSYRSIQRYKATREVKLTSAQQYCEGKSSQPAETNDCGTGDFPDHVKEQKSSNHHAGSHAWRRILLGMALRRCLSDLLNTEICRGKVHVSHKFSKEVVAPGYPFHHSSTGNENIAGANGSRNISHAETCVNFTSVSSDVECEVKRTISTDKVVSSVVEDSGPKESVSGSRTSDVNSTVIREDWSLENVTFDFMEYLHLFYQFAEELKVRSETLLNSLPVQKKPSS